MNPGDALVAVGLALLVLPDLVLLARTYWLTERGLHGAVIVALGGWLLWRDWPRGEPARRGDSRLVLALLVPVVIAHVFFWIIGSRWMIWSFACVAMALVVYDRLGAAGIRRLWFPLLFLLLAVPPSGRIMGAVTYVLTNMLSATAVEILWTFGWDIARDQTTIYLGPYELLVSDACAGLNSLIGLTAMGMLFLHLRRDSSPWRLAAMAVLIVPIVYAAGTARTVALLMLTDSLGDRAAQGPLHETTGVAMFVLAFAAFALLDHLLPRADADGEAA